MSYVQKTWPYYEKSKGADHLLVTMPSDKSSSTVSRRSGSLRSNPLTWLGSAG